MSIIKWYLLTRKSCIVIESGEVASCKELIDIQKIMIKRYSNKTIITAYLNGVQHVLPIPSVIKCKHCKSFKRRKRMFIPERIRRGTRRVFNGQVSYRSNHTE